MPGPNLFLVESTAVEPMRAPNLFSVKSTAVETTNDSAALSSDVTYKAVQSKWRLKGYRVTIDLYLFSIQMG